MTVLEEKTMYAIQSINQKLPDLELRDLFAMNTLNGLLSFKTTLSEKELAEKSYEIADAMLNARRQKNGK